MKDFGRVITAMVTPFHEDGSVNYEGAAELARHLVANGSDGLVVAGSTGEAATMTAEEKMTAVAIGTGKYVEFSAGYREEKI